MGAKLSLRKKRGEMMKFAARIAISGMLMSMSCVGQTKPSDGSPHTSSAKLERMPESLEVRYARSAAPPHLRDDATIFLLDPAKGYVLNRKGTNGVSCIVVRSDWQWPDRPFREDIAWPVCFDAEGSKTLLQDYIYAAELRARGMDVMQVHGEVTKRFGTVAYPNPARSGVAYMIAPVMRGFTNGTEPVTMNMPHYMFYAPGVTDADIGGKPFSHYPFMLKMSTGRDDVIIMLVGETEKAAILLASKDLLADLCSYRDYLCTTAATRDRMPND
jgi:hypothetical protein